MPRRKHYRRKKKKSSYYRTGKRYANYAYQGYKTAMYLKGLINTEFKFTDINLTGDDVDYNGFGTLLCTPAVGDTDTTRHGDSIRLKNIIGKGRIDYDSAGNANIQTVTLWLVQFKNATGLQPSELIANGYIGSVNAPYAPKDRDKRFLSKTLWKRTITVSAERPTSSFSIRISNLNTHEQFEAGTTNVNSGPLVLFAISNDSSATDGPNLYLQNRTSFIDN